MAGAFSGAALDLHQHGLVVVPAKDKKPIVSWGGWRSQSRQTVGVLARKFPDAQIGVVTGLSRLTIVDCDDERTLADAESRFGRTPLITRTPSGGGHLWFRSSGERCADLRPAANIDIKGVGGIVIAPPSLTEGKGSYRIERGGWDALKALPSLANGSLPTIRSTKGTGEGQRNRTLFNALRPIAPVCDSEAELLLEAHAINAQFAPPLSLAEVERTANSIWAYWREGRLFVPGMGGTLMLHAEQEQLSPDAFYLLAFLRRNHAGTPFKRFAIAPDAMARDQVLRGWGRKRYINATRELENAGKLTRHHRGGRYRGDASLFSLSSRKNVNVTDTLSPSPSPSFRDGRLTTS